METHIRALATWARMDRQRIGTLIRARREALGLTVRAAADLTDGDVPYSTWSQIETGRLNWSADKLASTLYALGVHLEVSLRPGRLDQPEDGARRQLLDRLASIVDQIDDTAVEALMSQVEVYERIAGVRRGL